jgi:hypothetical protein
VDVREHFVQIENFGLEHLPTAEHEQLTSETRRADAGLSDLLDVRAHRFAWVHLREERFAVAENHGQHVVEIMCNAPRKPADGVHLLRLAKLFFAHVERLLSAL